MAKAEKLLIVLLRLMAIAELLALVAVVMPFQWMAVIHRWLGLGELPDFPITGYLARSLSAMYAMQGAMLLFISFDIRRYLPLVRFLALILIVAGVSMSAIDVVVGMPLLWILGEGPWIILFGFVFLGLSNSVLRDMTAP